MGYAKPESHPMKVALTDRFVAGAKADSTGRSDYFDSVARGLSLRVTANGVKTWCFNCTRDGKRARFTIGSYPAASLAEARRLARERVSVVRKHPIKKQQGPRATSFA